MTGYISREIDMGCKMRLIVTGGGTGGHIYPAVAVAKKYLELDKKTQILYIGKKDGIEQDICKEQGIAFYGISADYRKKGLIAFIKYIFVLIKGLIQAFFAVKKFKPDVILGTGGYASFPAMIASIILKVPTVIHEANAVAGKANLLLSKWVDLVLVNFEKTQGDFSKTKKVQTVGFPVRKGFSKLSSIQCRKELSIPENSFVILCFGGSGGAKQMNDSIMGILPEIQKHEDIYLIHVTGKSYYKKFIKNMNVRNFINMANVNVYSYLYDMPKYMRAADLIISRSGASTIAEIEMSGSYAIFIPSPNVVNNHQEYNASFAVEQGLGLMFTEQELTDYKLINAIMDIKKNMDDISVERDKKVQQRLSSCDKVVSAIDNLIKDDM